MLSPKASAPKADVTEIRLALGLLLEPGQVAELRVLNTQPGKRSDWLKVRVRTYGVWKVQDTSVMWSLGTPTHRSIYNHYSTQSRGFELFTSICALYATVLQTPGRLDVVDPGGTRCSKRERSADTSSAIGSSMFQTFRELVIHSDVKLHYTTRTISAGVSIRHVHRHGNSGVWCHGNYV